MVITDRMEPFTADGEYYVPIVDNRLEMGGYEDAWPHWFRNFYIYCSNLGFDHGQVPITMMNRELKPVGGRLIQFDTQDGWILRWSHPSSHMWFILQWS